MQVLLDGDGHRLIWYSSPEAVDLIWEKLSEAPHLRGGCGVPQYNERQWAQVKHCQTIQPT